MRRAKHDRLHEKIVQEIKKAENIAGIEGLTADYPSASEITAIRDTYFSYPNIDMRKKLMGLREQLSKSFIQSAQLNVNEARKELAKAKNQGPKLRLLAAAVAIFSFDFINQNYGTAGIITELFCLYMVASYFDSASNMEREEKISQERSYFDQCAMYLKEARDIEYFNDSERHSGTRSDIFDMFRKI